MQRLRRVYSGEIFAKLVHILSYLRKALKLVSIVPIEAHVCLAEDLNLSLYSAGLVTERPGQMSVPEKGLCCLQGA
jgi:hypothetical protein